MNPLTSTSVIDHSSSIKNNVINVETVRVTSPSTIIMLIYFTDLFVSDFYLDGSFDK
jgi:hypothetical protein